MYFLNVEVGASNQVLQEFQVHRRRTIEPIDLSPFITQEASYQHHQFAILYEIKSVNKQKTIFWNAEIKQQHWWRAAVSNSSRPRSGWCLWRRHGTRGPIKTDRNSWLIGLQSTKPLDIDHGWYGWHVMNSHVEMSSQNSLMIMELLCFLQLTLAKTNHYPCDIFGTEKRHVVFSFSWCYNIRLLSVAST